MFSNILYILIGLLVTAVIYYAFVSDWLQDKFENFSERKLTSSNINKIARVKLVSEDAKDIEKFITANAGFLSNEMVGHLISRIEYLQDCSALKANDIDLKNRIDSSTIKQEVKANGQTRP
jgi:hypothetical protein